MGGRTGLTTVKRNKTEQSMNKARQGKSMTSGQVRVIALADASKSHYWAGAVSTVNLRPALHSKIRRVKLPGQASRRILGRASRQTEHARYQDENKKEKRRKKAPGRDRRRRKLVWSSPHRWRRGRRRDVLCTANKLQPGAHLSIDESTITPLARSCETPSRPA